MIKIEANSELSFYLKTSYIVQEILLQRVMNFNGWFFNLGLLISSLSYFKNSRLGTILVLIGTLVIYIGSGSFNVLGYIVLTVGFYINFYRQSLSQNG